MHKLLPALVAVGAIAFGINALVASGASNQQYVYGGGHFNVNFGAGNPSPPRDFSLAATGSPTAASGRILAGQDQSGGGGGLSITVLCYAISPATNTSGGRTAVVGGTIDNGPQAGNQIVFFVQDNTTPGGPAGVYDQASAFYTGPSGFLTIGRKGTSCPDPDSTAVGPSDNSAPVLYSDVTSGDVVVSG